MAVTIKLKNASGSDPTASDLVVGEVAIRTDTGKLFTKKDDSSGATFTIDNDVVTFAKMQNVSTSRLLGRTTSSSGDIEELTASAVRTLLNVADGATNVTNTNQLTNGAGFITATLTNEQVQDIVGGMVTGNTETGITVTYQDGDGTLDFVVGTLNQDTTGNAATATALETARTIGGVSFDGTSNINLAGVNTSGNQDTSGNAATATKLATARTIAGVSFDGSANISLNNNAITNGAGYITSADGGNAATLDSLDSTSFLRSDTADTASGDISFSGGAGAATIAADSDIRFTNGSWTGDSTKIQHHSNWLYVQGGTNGILFRHVDGSNRWQIDDSGHFRPNSDSSVDIGRNTVRVANGYFDTLYGDGSNLTGISATVAGGAVYENAQSITSNYTVTNGKNAMSAGPIEIASGVTVTIGSGETYTIV